jgi:hypothetical protein
MQSGQDGGQRNATASITRLTLVTMQVYAVGLRDRSPASRLPDTVDKLSSIVGEGRKRVSHDRPRFVPPHQDQIAD